jgi:hypothetical protein
MSAGIRAEELQARAGELLRVSNIGGERQREGEDEDCETLATLTGPQSPKGESHSSRSRESDSVREMVGGSPTPTFSCKTRNQCECVVRASMTVLSAATYVRLPARRYSR